MTDIHTHILYDIDDGAKDVDTSVKMLDMEISDGVDTVVLTPHFDPAKQNIEEFIIRRDTRATQLKNAFTGKISIVCGAEVVASPFIADTNNLDLLCIEGTKCILIELPASNFLIWIEDMVYKLQLAGYTPILAHIERYKELRDLKLLKRLCDMGCITQITASLFDAPGFSDKRFIKKAAALGLIHTIGSDCHSVSWRPPCLSRGLQNAQKLISSDFSKKLIFTTDSVVKKGALPYDSFII